MTGVLTGGQAGCSVEEHSWHSIWLESTEQGLEETQENLRRYHWP